ncbi:MAG: AraC family transcriptional regulator [Eubacteriales bacterium]
MALDVGFSSTSYFIACFRKYKKMSPGEFRHYTGKNL